MGPKLVRSKGVVGIAAALAVAAACKPAPPALRRAQQVPKIRATVVTVQTTIQPGNRTTAHLLVIANGLARSGDEVDVWRLFDFGRKEVAFVDDLAHSYRRQPFDAIFADRVAALTRPVPDGMPRVQFAASGAKRAIHGVEASESVIHLGGYQRHLWIAKHPALPPELFAVMLASTPPSSPLAGIAREAEEALLEIDGFALVDHAELSYGKSKVVVDTIVTKIEQRDVPEAWLKVPGGYREASSEQRSASSTAAR
jgi:hypothetical protein